MSPKAPCFFHRHSNSLTIGRGIGYCDMDNAWVICDGDHRLCESSNTQMKHQLMGGRMSERSEGFNSPAV